MHNIQKHDVSKEMIINFYKSYFTPKFNRLKKFIEYSNPEIFEDSLINNFFVNEAIVFFHELNKYIEFHYQFENGERKLYNFINNEFKNKSKKDIPSIFNIKELRDYLVHSFKKSDYISGSYVSLDYHKSYNFDHGLYLDDTYIRNSHNVFFYFSYNFYMDNSESDIYTEFNTLYEKLSSKNFFESPFVKVFIDYDHVSLKEYIEKKEYNYNFTNNHNKKINSQGLDIFESDNIFHSFYPRTLKFNFALICINIDSLYSEIKELDHKISTLIGIYE